MKKLLVVAVVVLMSFPLSLFAEYQFSPADEKLLDAFEQKIEKIIAEKGESMRQTFYDMITSFAKHPRSTTKFAAMMTDVSTRIAMNGEINTTLNIIGNNNQVAITNNQNSNNATVINNNTTIINNSSDTIGSNNNNNTQVGANTNVPNNQTPPSNTNNQSTGNNNTTTGNNNTNTGNNNTNILNVVRTDGLGNTNIAVGSSNLTVYQAKLSSDQANGVTVSNISFSVIGNNNATNGYLNNASLTLYVNGVAKKTKTITNSTVTFDGFTIPVTKSTPATVTIKANFNEAFSAGTFSLTLYTMNAVDKLTSAAITYNKPAGATFTIGNAAGTIAESNSNPQAQLLLSTATNQKLLGFKVTAANDNISLYDVTLIGTNLDKFTNFRLQDSNGTDVASATTATSTSVTFSAMTAPTILMDKTANYFVVADVNSVTTGAITLRLNVASSNIKASNGTIKATAGVNVNAAAHVIAENTMAIAKATNSSKSLTTSALRFTVTAYGKNQVTLKNIDFTTLLAGYVDGSAQISVYQTTTDAANLAGQTAVGSVAGARTVSLTVKNTVDAGDTVTYIVAIEGMLVNSSSTSQDWSVSMTDIDFNGGWGILTAATYANFGSLPMTETK